jgi:hypothetical protein
METNIDNFLADARQRSEADRTPNRRWSSATEETGIAEGLFDLVGQGRFPGVFQARRQTDEPWSVGGFEHDIKPLLKLAVELLVAGERIVEVHEDGSYVIEFDRGGRHHRKTVGGKCDACRQTLPDREFSVRDGRTGVSINHDGALRALLRNGDGLVGPGAL